MTLRAVAVLLVAAIGFCAVPAVSATAWERLWEKDGVLVEHRTAAGARLSEIRATAQSPLPPVAVFETIWKYQEYPEFVPFLKRLTVLSETGDERVAYEQLAVPLVKDRDYTIRLRRRVDGATHRYEVTIESANDAGPPPDGTHVRVTGIRGGWTVEPGPQGKGSLVRYEMKSDPGGLIPSWVVERTMPRAAADLMRAMLKRAWDKNGAR